MRYDIIKYVIDIISLFPSYNLTWCSGNCSVGSRCGWVTRDWARQYAAVSVPCVQDGAGVWAVVEGEHLAPIHWPKQLQEFLTLRSISNGITLPEDIAKEVTIFLDHGIFAITCVRILAHAVFEVRLRPCNDGVTWGDVAVGEEAAGEAGPVIAPVGTIILNPTQLLAEQAGSLITREPGCQDNFIRIRVTISYRH